MQIVNFNTKIEQKTAIALGVFDGVHIGHQEVINQTINFKSLGLKSVVLTFKYDKIKPESKSDGKIILTESLKTQILENLGVDILINPYFNDIQSIDYKYFAEDILIKRFNAKVLVCGNDYKFGCGAKGNIELLKQICLKNNVELISLDKIKLFDNEVSSTLIKQLIKNGDMENVRKYLGYYYSYDFKVSEGMKLARTLGFPTINQVFNDEYIIPKYGVYASFVYIFGKKYKGVTNIGVKPTITKNNIPIAETYIIGFNEQLYNKNIKVSLIHFLRPEKKFDSILSLSQQIKKDVKISEKLLTL